MKTFSMVLLSLLIGLSISDRSIAEVYTTCSAADNNGNIIVIGYCLGNVRIAGQEFTITQPSSFILKLDSDGEMIWVKFINSNQSIKANAVAVDGYGNVYVTGEFSGTANFGSFSLTSQGTDAFIVKLDSTGNVEWVKHGQSSGTARGNDIYIADDGITYVCGFGTPVSFDSLSTSGGGFTLKISPQGNIILLFNSLDNSYHIILDVEKNIIICGGQWSHVYNYYLPQLGKFTNQGNLIWKYHGVAPSNVSTKFFPVTDSSRNIYTALQHSNKTFLSKSDLNGSTITPLFGYMNFQTTDFKFKDQSHFLLTGAYLSNAQFGDSTLTTNGSVDAYIAKIDSGFNPIWIASGGGFYDDELNSVSLLNDGNILCGGNFKGTILIDTLEITGGNYADDKWAAIVKYDSAGNLLWFKKIAENFITPTSVNWFPLEVGNKVQHYAKRKPSAMSTSIDYFLKLFQVTDSVWINNKKYYSVDGFRNFASGTRIRYDEETQRILVLHQNQEYLYMDFSKVGGETFQQIQNTGAFLNTLVISTNLVIQEDTLAVKGFYNVLRIVYPYLPIIEIYTWVYFAPEIGLVFQEEECANANSTDLLLIEYLISLNGQFAHKKHSETATIIFQPVSFIVEDDSLYQGFTVLHPLSKQNVPASSYFSYINSYLQSFYLNGTDTIWNPVFNIQQITEKDFILNYQFDTTKYQQSYHLYYRIAAVDKGIVADTFYSPIDGYYKLFWKDSTTSVTQTEFQALSYSLYQNFPNPFNPSSKISFTIPARNFVSLKVFDVLGSEIVTLVNEELDTGKYEVEFSGNDLSSGIYIYQIRAGSFIDTKKMILLR